MRVEGPGFVMMSGESGPIQVTLVNDLDQTVTVGLRVTTPGSDLTFADVPPETLGPGRRTSVRLEATSHDIGVHAVTLLATDESGAPLGSEARFSVRSSNVSTVIWVIMAVGGALLLRRDRHPAGPPHPPPQVHPRAAAAPRHHRPRRPGGRRMSPATGADNAAARDAEPSILSSSALMAAGTVVSRMSGFVRNALLAAALGQALHGDVFTIANTIPNMLYILLAGGVFNAVLVPQLVRAQRNDPDGGDGYTNRIITLAAVFLAGVSAVLVIAAPVVMRLFLDHTWFAPELTQQRESVIAFARYCLPQVFFYGMFVLVGQVLNARRSFGPMMWAPIANNVISVAVLVVYLWVFGPVQNLCNGGNPGPGVLGSPGSTVGGYTSGQEMLLGLGSTAGHRGAAADPGAVPAAGRLPVPAAVRLARHRARAHPAAGHLDGAVRDRQPGRLHGGGADRLVRHRGRRRQRLRHRPPGHRLHDLLQRVPAGDGAALDRDGLAGHRDAAAAVVVRRGRRPRAGWPAPWRRRCGRRTR